jgi:hypothetical protein
MKAWEISEATVKLPEIAKSAAGVWYETSATKVKSWYKHMRGAHPKLDADVSVRYFVFVPVNQKLWGLDNRVLQFSNGDLGSVGTTGEFYTHMEADALQALVDVIHAKHGERVWGDFILYQGKVYHEHAFLATLPHVGEISTGAVHEVPPDALWCLRRLRLKYQLNADKVLVFRKTSSDVSEPWLAVSIRDGKMSEIQSQHTLDKITQVQLSKELAAALGMEQKVTVSTHIMPNSKLHRTLMAIQENPGIGRAHLYWTALKLKQLPAYLSKEDVAAELVKLGLVQEEGIGLMSLTPIGKLVLARVNAGKPVSKASLIKQ